MPPFIVFADVQHCCCILSQYLLLLLNFLLLILLIYNTYCLATSCFNLNNIYKF